MENYSAEIVDNIKQEPEQHYFFEIPKKPEQATSGIKTDEPQQNSSIDGFNEDVDNIKEEPERHYVVIIPEEPKPTTSGTQTRNPSSENAVQSKKSSSFQKNRVDKKTYECGYCDEKFDSYKSKENHVARVHFSDSSWKCFKCSYSTLSRTKLTQHYKSHSKKFSCETCSQKFSTRQNLKQHQQQHQHGVYAMKPITFECSQCVCSYPSGKGLREHRRNVHIQKKLQCDVCAKIFNSKVFIRQHIEIHFKIQCPVCPRILTRYRLNAHIKQHSLTAKFSCEVCKKVFRSLQYLNQHKKKFHEVENGQCDYCYKFFKNKYLLTQHIQIHVKAPCSVCGKPINKRQMKKHMKSIHPSGKQFMPCKITKCHQKFSDIKELNKHQQIHIGTGLYKCSKCEYEAKRLQLVLQHIKIKSH